MKSRRQFLLTILLVIALGVAGCGDDDSDEGARLQTAPPASQPETATIATDATTQASGLSLGVGWQWQLQGELNTSYDVLAYDVDLFDVTADQIGQLEGDDRFVICYFSAGSAEDWREDAQLFPVESLGNPLDGWEGERWLDIRDDRVVNVLRARIDLAAEKGCHAVEPDNVTAFNNETGFDISPDDQLRFNRALAEAAHERGLLIGLKNDLEQIAALVESFDFAVNEQCLQYDECEVYAPFIDAGKPVFNAEYAAEFVADPTSTCSRARVFGLSTVIYSVELDDSLRIAC